MEVIIEKWETKDGFEVRVSYDEFHDSPREWDNLTNMFCFHRRYDLGDKHQYDKGDFDSWEELKKQIELDYEVEAIFALFLYDHSGQSISYRSFVGRAQHAEWDSGQVGFVFITKDKLVDEGLKELIGNSEKLEECIRTEVETYNKYISGEAYRFEVWSKDGYCVDGCGGYYSIDEIRESIDDKYLMSEYIKQTTPLNQLQLL